MVFFSDFVTSTGYLPLLRRCKRCRKSILVTFLDRLFATLPNQFSQMNHLVTITATIGDVISK